MYFALDKVENDPNAGHLDLPNVRPFEMDKLLNPSLEGTSKSTPEEGMRWPSPVSAPAPVSIPNDVRRRSPVMNPNAISAMIPPLSLDCPFASKRPEKKRKHSAEAQPQPRKHHHRGGPEVKVKASNSSCRKSPFQVENFEPIRTIGTGTFGRVQLVRHREHPKLTMALKCMQKATIVDLAQQQNVMQEKKILQAAVHPFILRLFATSADADRLYMLCELVQGGELWSLLYERPRHQFSLPKGPHKSFDLTTSRFYSANVICVLAYLKPLQIAYRDLKPENLLVDTQGYLKLVDFGFAKELQERASYRTYTLCGTPEYLAPELVLNKGHGTAVDYWALGCLLYELLLGKTPFQSSEEPKIFEKIINASKSLRFPKTFDVEAKDLIQRLLQPNPALRLGALAGGIQDIMNHPWFSAHSFDWQAMLSKSLPAPYVPPIQNSEDVLHFDVYPETHEVVPYTGPDFFIGF